MPRAMTVLSASAVVDSHIDGICELSVRDAFGSVLGARGHCCVPELQLQEHD